MSKKKKKKALSVLEAIKKGHCPVCKEEADCDGEVTVNGKGVGTETFTCAHCGVSGKICYEPTYYTLREEKKYMLEPEKS